MRHQELTWPQRGRLWLRLGIRLLIAVFTILLLWKAGPPVLSLFMPFVLAFFAAVLLNPLVRWLQQKLGWSRKVLSFLTLLVIFGLVGILLGYLIRSAAREIMALVDNWEVLFSSIQTTIYQAEQFLEDLAAQLPVQLTVDDTVLNRITSWLLTFVQGALSDLDGLTNLAREGALSISSFALSLLMFLMGSYFISSDYPTLRSGFVERMEPDTRDFLREVKHTLMSAFGGYLKAEVLLSVGVFFILLVGFLIIGQSYALLLALALAVLDFIPIIGSGTIMVPWAVICIFTGNLATTVELMAIWLVIVLFRRVAEPKFVGNQTGLSPILSLISIYVGMKVAGVAGMILGPILTLLCLNLLDLGVLDGTKADLKLAAEDVMTILGFRKGVSAGKKK